MCVQTNQRRDVVKETGAESGCVFLSIKAGKPVLTVTEMKINNLKISIICHMSYVTFTIDPHGESQYFFVTWII